MKPIEEGEEKENVEVEVVEEKVKVEIRREDVTVIVSPPSNPLQYPASVLVLTCTT